MDEKMIEVVELESDLHTEKPSLNTVLCVVNQAQISSLHFLGTHH